MSGFVYFKNELIEWDKLLPSLIGVLLGGVFGAFTLNKIKSRTAGIVFALIMIFAGIRMVV
jgi:uncharacterized membrane protein YfcA